MLTSPSRSASRLGASCRRAALALLLIAGSGAAGADVSLRVEGRPSTGPIEAFVRDIPMTRRHLTWAVLQRLESRLSELADVPALFIWGMRDWCFTPACLDRLLEHFPNAAIERLTDAGHYVVEDAHERIVPRLKEFIG